MKRTQFSNFLWTALGLLCLSHFVACRPQNIQPEPPKPEQTITITPHSLNLKKGEKQQLKATVQPEDKKVVINWKSEDPTTVKVSPNGEIEALKVGNTMVTARIEGTQKQASCLVMVVAGEQPTPPTPPTSQADVEIIHSFAKDYSIVFNVVTQSGKILIDNGNKIQTEYAVSTQINAPTQLSVSADQTEKSIRIYAPDLLLLSADNNGKIEQINLIQTPQLQVLSAPGNHLKSIDLQAAPILTRLDLKENKFMGNLTLTHHKLTHCDLSNNAITSVNLDMPNLVELRISAMGLEKLTSWSAYPQLKKLVVDHNKLSEAELKKAISSLPKRSGEKGKMVVLDAKNAMPEGNKVTVNTLLPLAEKQGWELYDGDTKLKQSVETDDPKGFDFAQTPYLQWSGTSIDAIKAWEKNNKGTFNAGLSETDDEEEILLVFDVTESDIYKRVYTLEGNSLLQVEIFVHPLSLLLVQGDGAKLRLNKNTENSLKNHRYSSLGEGYNTFRFSNDNLKSNLVISKENDKQEQVGKLLFSPKR